MISKPLIAILLVLTASVYTINSAIKARQDSKKLTIVTKYDQNMLEVKSLIKGAIREAGIKLSTMSKGISLYQGEPEEAAIMQARESFKIAGVPVLVEVEVFEFEALNGLPGHYIQEFYDKIGNEGLTKLLSTSDNKSSTMKSIFVYLNSDAAEPQVFVGETRGQVVEHADVEGWKWEGIFIPEGYNTTLAELDPESKKKVYQRRLALDKFLKYIAKTPYWI